jgi:hypothetical protein
VYTGPRSFDGQFQKHPVLSCHSSTIENATHRLPILVDQMLADGFYPCGSLESQTRIQVVIALLVIYRVALWMARTGLYQGLNAGSSNVPVPWR